MSKKKSGRALFEVITTYRQKHPGTGPLMPEWMRRRTAGEGEDIPQLRPEPVEEEPLPSPQEPPPNFVSLETEEPAERPIATLRPLEPPMVSVIEGRLNLSLNYVSSVVVLLGVVVLLVGMFLLGRASIAPAVAKTPDTRPAVVADAKPPVKPLRNTEPRQVTPRRETPSTPKVGLNCPELTKGKFYLLIQVISGGNGPEQKAQAVRIAEYCNSTALPAADRVPATVGTWITDEGEKICVVMASEPFESRNLTARVKTLAQKVWTLGARQENPTKYNFKPDEKYRLWENKG